MIIEDAHVKIKEEQNQPFETAAGEAVAVFRCAPESRGLRLQRCIKAPQDHQVVIRRDRLEAHTATFRKGPLSQEWRGLVGGFFAEPPQVRHSDIAMPLADL